MKWRGVSEREQQSTSAPLREQLLEIRANIAQYVPPEKQAVHERAIEKVRASGPAERAPKRGAKLPEFEAPDQNGDLVRSQELLRQGPLVVVFFRGRWCPFCVTTLEAWRDQMPAVLEAGANLVAISPMSAKHASFTAAQHKLPFPVLCDAGNQVAESFGLRYRVEEEQRRLYQSVFINLPQQNGDESWTLPVAATFAANSDGTIVFSQVDADYRLRAEPAEVIATLA